MKAIIYCRVSSAEQQANGTSLDVQESTCREYAERNGYAVVRVVREARSGASLARGGLDEIRDIAKRREVQAVIVTEQDRLSRSLADTYVLMEEFEVIGVALLFVNEPTDSSDEGKMYFGLKGLFKQYERAKIVERTRRGKRQRSSEGRVLPGPRVTYGYSYAEGKYEINESGAATVRLIFDLLTKRQMSCNAVANALTDRGIPTPGGGQGWRRTTVHRILCNKAYTGTYYYGKFESVLPLNPQKDARERKREKSAQRRREITDTICVSIPVIIDQTTFDRAQERLKANKTYSARNERHAYLLRSMVLCGKCGRRYAGQFTHGARVYICPFNQRYGKAKRCGARQYQADTLERGVWEAVLRRLSDPTALLEGIDDQATEAEQYIDRASIARLAAEQQKIEREQAQVWGAYKAQVITLAEFTAERTTATKRLNEIADIRAAIEDREQARQETTITAGQLAQIRAWFYMQGAMQPSFEKKRRLLENLSIRVTVDGEKVFITGLLTDHALEVDLDEARTLSSLDREAWKELMRDIAAMHDEGRHEEAERALEIAARGRENGTLMLSITPPPGAAVYDNTPALAAFMSPCSQ